MLSKKVTSVLLSALILFSVSCPAYAAAHNTSATVGGIQSADSSTALADKLQMSDDKLNHLSPEMVARLHHDFDDVYVIGTKKIYYALEKSNDLESPKVVAVPESVFDAITSPGIQTFATGSDPYAGVGTLTSYILSDNSLAMSMDLLDSFHPGGSGSYSVALTLNNLYGTQVGGTTLYSRTQYGDNLTDEGTIYSGSDYKTTEYTVPQMVPETNRYFYLGTDCEGVTAHQVLKTDFTVCLYNLGLTDGLPSSYINFLQHFFISSSTYHYPGKVNS